MKNKNDANKPQAKDATSTQRLSPDVSDNPSESSTAPLDDIKDNNSIVDAVNQEKDTVSAKEPSPDEPVSSSPLNVESVQDNNESDSNASKNNTPQQSKAPLRQHKLENSQATSSGLSKLAVLCLVLIVILFGAGGWGFYQLYQQLNGEQLSITALDETHQQEMSSAKASISQHAMTLSQVERTFSEQLSQQQQTIVMLQEKMVELAGRRPSDWLIAEANYLVKLAGRKLWQEKNIATASALLTNADMRIAEMNDPSLIMIRQALAADIASLQALPRDNSEDLALKIDGLISQVDQLKLNMVELPELAEESDDGQLSESTDDWQENLKRMWDSFSEGYITVRRRTGTVEPLMSPKQQWYLEENLKSKLMQTQLAVYRQQQDAYEHSIELSTRWIMQFFDRQDSTTQFMLKELAELQRQKVNIEYPTSLTSSPLIADALRARSIGYDHKLGR